MSFSRQSADDKWPPCAYDYGESGRRIDWLRPHGRNESDMTPRIDEYYTEKQPVRKKEPQYIAYINKNSCTSCGACATMCPVDCIYEVVDSPGQSYHVIDTARCIGCQMCYRVPSESTGPWTMEICPWNAIDLIYNPNFAEKGAAERPSLLEPYYAGSDKPNFKKLEELGYQLYLNRLLYVKKGSDYEKALQPFIEASWTDGDSSFPLLRFAENSGEIDVYVVTEPGDDLIDFLYRDYDHMFLD